MDTLTPLLSYFFQIISECDLAFDTKVLISHFDLILWFSDFDLYLDTHKIYDHTYFTLRLSMTRPLTPKYLKITVS